MTTMVPKLNHLHELVHLVFSEGYRKGVESNCPHNCSASRPCVDMHKAKL